MYLVFFLKYEMCLLLNMTLHCARNNNNNNTVKEK